MNTFTLANGLALPAIGYGTYKATEGGDHLAIRAAIDAGYRYFDTASFYGTEEALGRAIRESGIPREEFQIASKLWRTEMGYEAALQAFERSRERLGTEYLDLYLIHWPRPDADADWIALVQQTWRALDELYIDGHVRAIGVSNFLPHHLEALTENAKTCPMVNQIEFHPGYPQQDTLDFCEMYGIVVQAWSPLGRTRVLADPVVADTAAKHGVSAAQVCLRYALQKNVMPLPKASAPARLLQNLDVFGFSLDAADMARLDAMPETGWSGIHPDRF